MKIGTSLVAICLFASLAAPALRAQTAISLAYVGAPGSLVHESVQAFVRRINERFGSELEIAVLQERNSRVVLGLLQSGEIDLAVPSVRPSVIAEEFALFELPYVVKDRAHIQRIEREIFWDVLAPAAEEKGYKVLAFWELGFSHVTNSVRPIHRPEDLKGMKLRTTSSPWRLKMFNYFGALPIPFPLAEVNAALSHGVVEGQETTLDQILIRKLYEVQKFLSLTGHVYTPAFVLANRSRWEGMAPEVRRALEEVARETHKEVYEIAVGMERKLLEQLADRGLSINDVDREAFIRVSSGIYDEFASTVPLGGKVLGWALSLAE